MASFAENAKKAFPAEIHMISCQSSDLDSDFKNVGSFDLPAPGKAGICTAALIHALWRDQLTFTPEPITWVDLLKRMRSYLEEHGARNYLPQLSASRKLKINQPFSFVPAEIAPKCKKRAVLIGINYVGQVNALSKSHENVNHMKSYLIKVQGFEESNITVLMDDNVRQEPTRQNILAALRRISKLSQAGDVAFIHYSGHGGRWKDNDEDEKSGYEETLVPTDFATSGHIHEDELYKSLVCAMSDGVHATIVMDACHSVVSLPYKLDAPLDKVMDGMSMSEQVGYEFAGILTLVASAAIVGSAVALGEGANSGGLCCECCVELWSEWITN